MTPLPLFEQTAYYKALMRKMVAAIMTVSFIPVFLVSSAIFYQFRLSYKEKIYAQFMDTVQKHSMNIDRFITSKFQEIQYLSRSIAMQDITQDMSLRRQLVLMQKVYGPVLVDMGVIDDQGLQIAYAGPYALTGARYTDAGWFRKVMADASDISDVFLGLRGSPHFIVAVRNSQEGRPWTLRATIDFNAFNALVEGIRGGKTGIAFIVNRDAEFQTRPAVNIVPDKRLIQSLFQKKTLSKKPDNVHLVETVDVSGVKVIYAASFLKNGEWLLVYRQNAAEAFSKLNQMQVLSILIFILGGVGIVIMAYLISGRMVHRIAVSDHEKEILNQQVIETGRLASIGELAAGIAHEINNPVAIMVEEAGWIQDLLDEEDFRQSENLEEFRRAVAQIKTQGARCKDITHKLLSFARKTDPRQQNVQINDLVSELVALSDQRARRSMVVIHAELMENLPLLRLSVSELQQVILNLINNAIDAMERKGGELFIYTRQEERWVVIEVSDTGCGIPEDNLQRIFDPFFTTKPVGKGTGLGLAICYGIVRKMGGDIRVRSTLNVGTVFTVYLPIATPDRYEAS